MKLFLVLVVAVAIVSAACGARASAAAFNSLPLFQAATNSLALINFDTLPGGSPAPTSGDIGSSYAVAGAVFPSGNQFAEFVQAVSIKDGWLVDLTNSEEDAVFDVDITAPNITAVGVHNALFSANVNGARLDALSGNVVLASAPSDANGQTLDFFGVTTAQPITHVTIRVFKPFGLGWGLDNFYLGKAIPEPGTAALLAIASATIGSARRTPSRRRATC
jgi:hypothetical protein